MRDARIERVVGRSVVVLEIVTIAILVVLVVLALGGLVVELVGAFTPPFLAGDRLGRVLDDVLAVFVLLELLVTAIAYVRGTDVLRRIFEAVFVAIARKLIALDVASSGLAKAGALAILLVATAGAWWLVARARVEPAADGQSDG